MAPTTTLVVPTPHEVSALVYPSLDELTALLPDTPDVHRFLAKVEVGDVPSHAPHLGPCLRWTAATRGGYAFFRGNMRADGKRPLVHGHVWLWETLNRAKVPAGYELDHICHDPMLCVSPGENCPHRRCVLHTGLKTISANRRRTASSWGVNAAKTTCDTKWSPRAADGTLIGHDWSDPAVLRVYTTKDGRKLRICLPCQAARMADWQAKQRRLKQASKDKGLAAAGQMDLLAG